MLNLENVSAGYNDKTIINNISIKVENNKNLCILGPNGCGKTTLIKAISGLIPSTGKIMIDNQDVTKMKREEIAKKIAVMSQISSIYFSYTVYETVLLGRYLYMKNNYFSGPSKEDKDCVNKCLQAVGLKNYSHRQINSLSGGQLQRVYLARTLAQEPHIILLDEPTNHLDLKHQTELIEFLKEWSKLDNHIVIGVLHDINLAMSFADDILILSNGNIVSYGKSNLSLTRETLNKTYDMDVVSYMQTALSRWNNF